MVCTQSMVQPSMHGTGINEVGQGHLVDAAQTLKIWMGNNVEYKGIVYADKTINRVINYFSHGGKDSVSPLSAIFLSIFSIIPLDDVTGPLDSLMMQ